MALHETPERVLLAFAQLADLLGTPQPDGAMRIDSLTHQTIADYVGTSGTIGATLTFTCAQWRKRSVSTPSTS